MGSSQYYEAGRQLDNPLYEAWLPGLLQKIGPAGRGLWLMHEPPSQELADRWAYCSNGERAVREFQPLIVVSGHDHNHPQRHNRWFTEIGQTVAVNVGQRVYPSPGRLLYCTVDFEIGADELLRLTPKGITRHGT